MKRSLLTSCAALALVYALPLCTLGLEGGEKEENPTAAELAEWIRKSGLPLKRFFNTSGLKYKELDLKNRLSSMSDEEQLTLLASDGMLVKRPILITETTVLPGFREPEWAKVLGC